MRMSGARSAVAVQVVERRQQLVQGQVASAAKNQHVAGGVQQDDSGFACAVQPFM
jgi:hypothetical protein